MTSFCQCSLLYLEYGKREKLSQTERDKIMGYTHYYRGFVTIREDLLDDVEAIINASSTRIRNWEGEEEPELTSTLISLNGDEATGGAHETLRIEGYDTETEKNRNGVNRGFCKTARKDYDEVVGAILLRTAFYNRGFKVSSDGDWAEDWAAPRALYERVFGVEAKRPDEVTESYAARAVLV